MLYVIMLYVIILYVIIFVIPNRIAKDSGQWLFVLNLG